MKELIIIRHGESEHHINGLTGGWTESRLTEKGHLQAGLTAKHLQRALAKSGFELFSSDQLRARLTAQYISESLDQPIQFDGNLRELNNGLAADKTREEAKKMERPFTAPALDWVPYPQAESWRMLHARVTRGMEAIHQRAVDTTVVVSHGNAIVCMVNWWLQISEDHHLENIMYKTDPCGITQLNLDDRGCRMIYRLNDTAHLD